MSRSYKSIRLKEHRVYSAEDLMGLFNVSKNTVTNWGKAGLQRVDQARPHLFRGATVKAFHDARRKRDRTNLRPGEFRCKGCKMAVFPVPGSIEERPSRNGTKLLTAQCSECGAHLFQFASIALKEPCAEQRNPNTTETCAHESGRAARDLNLMMRQETGVAKARSVAAYVRTLAEAGEAVLVGAWGRSQPPR